ncbi:MAG: hypothetical protein AAF721_02745 [Myxococcota bacterium]
MSALGSLSLALACTPSERAVDPPVATQAPAAETRAEKVEPPEPQPAATESPAPPEAPSKDAPLVVAGPNGIAAVALDGTVVTRFSDAAARSPRWLPGKKAVVFLDVEGGRSVALGVLDLVSGSRTRVAKLPTRPPCRARAYDPEWGPPILDVRLEDEFWVNRSGKYACMTLSDHCCDLRDNQRAVAISVAHGRTHTVLEIGGSECAAKESDRKIPACQRRPLDVDVDDAEPERTPFGGYVVSTSPDGTWQLVEVASVLADVLHMQYVVYAPAERSAFPLPLGASAPWPSKVSLPKGLDGETMVEGLPEVGGGATTRWVGPHHLVVERTLFIAGERVVALDGDIAI